MKIYKIYTLEHPLTKEIRYVGFTSRPLNKRLGEHCCTGKSSKNTHIANWCKSLVYQGFRPVITLLDQTDNKARWAELEKYWVSQFKTWGFDLTNLTEGGEGVPGHKPTRKAKEKFSKPICRYDLQGNYIDSFGSTVQAEKLTGVSKTCIHRAIKEKGNAFGYQWRFFTEDYTDNIGKLRESSLLRCKIHQYSSEGVFIKSWEGATQVESVLGIAHVNIAKVMRGVRPLAGGFIWSYDKAPLTIKPKTKKLFRKVVVKIGTEIRTFKDQRLAAKYLEIDHKHLNGYLMGKIKQVKKLKNKEVYFGE